MRKGGTGLAPRSEHGSVAVLKLAKTDHHAALCAAIISAGHVLVMCLLVICFGTTVSGWWM